MRIKFCDFDGKAKKVQSRYLGFESTAKNTKKCEWCSLCQFISVSQKQSALLSLMQMCLQ